MTVLEDSYSDNSRNVQYVSGTDICTVSDKPLTSDNLISVQRYINIDMSIAVKCD